MKQPDTPQAPLTAILGLTVIQCVFFGVGLLAVYAVVTLNWYILAAYALVIVAQVPINGRKQKYVDFLIKYTKGYKYAHFTRHYEEPVPHDEKTVFCFHPHGVFGYGLMLNLNHADFPDEKLSKSVGLASRFALSMPVIGLHMKMWGLESADPSNFKRLMREGKPISMLPGGYEEATLTTPHEFRVYIKQRKGFIKYALQHGYTVRHVLIMNEHRAMWTFDALLPLRLLLNKLKIPGTIYWGRWGLFFPPNVQMTTIIGRGLRGRQYAPGESPSLEQINQFHANYVQQLRSLYSKHSHLNQKTPFKVY